MPLTNISNEDFNKLVKFIHSQYGIDLSQKKDSAVFLRIGGRKWFDGMMGVSEKHLAVKIKQVYQNAERRDIQGKE